MKILRLILLLLWPSLLLGQSLNVRIFGELPAYFSSIPWNNLGKIYGVTVNHITSGLDLTDNFNSYTAGDLAGQGNWVSAQVGMTVIDVAGNKQITPKTGDRNLIYRSEAFTANHSARVTITAVTNSSFVGPAVRVDFSGGVAYGYVYYADGFNRYLKYFNATTGAAGATIASVTGNAININDVLTLEANGSTIKCYKNGTLDTSLTGGTGIFTDTNVPAAGKPGMGGFTTGSMNMDTWEGKDL